MSRVFTWDETFNGRFQLRRGKMWNSPLDTRLSSRNIRTRKVLAALEFSSWPGCLQETSMVKIHKSFNLRAITHNASASQTHSLAERWVRTCGKTSVAGVQIHTRVQMKVCVCAIAWTWISQLWGWEDVYTCVYTDMFTETYAQTRSTETVKAQHITAMMNTSSGGGKH